MTFTMPEAPLQKNALLPSSSGVETPATRPFSAMLFGTANNPRLPRSRTEYVTSARASGEHARRRSGSTPILKHCFMMLQIQHNTGRTPDDRDPGLSQPLSSAVILPGARFWQGAE